ncbi:HIT family protein [Planctomycetota bacterium]|nr:HIT family protein [Planctomycetota bacterium]
MASQHDDNCIFCKIINGDIPCHKIYEDDRVLAFIDIGPISKGHTLIIPKYHAAEIVDVPEEYAAACGMAIPKIAKAVQGATGCPAYNILQNNGQLAGQAVFHVHFHIIPRYSAETGLNYKWIPGQLDETDAVEMKAAIANNLK